MRYKIHFAPAFGDTSYLQCGRKPRRRLAKLGPYCTYDFKLVTCGNCLRLMGERVKNEEEQNTCQK